MMTREKLLHFAIIVTVSISGLLLGLGQGDMFSTLVAIGGALSAFMITEVFKLFRFDQWFANIAAIIVTAYALAGFGGGDRVYQLILVANLLVYLQTILLFQEKTPRLYWQVLVLSLLQVVVAAVFNLGFEGGMLFIVYMVVAGGTTMLLYLHQDSWNITRQNEETRQRFSTRRESETGSKTIWFDPHPVAVFDVKKDEESVLVRQIRYFASFGVMTIALASVLFFLVPRDSNAWSGPRDTIVRDTGASKFLNLNFTGIIRLTSEPVMRVSFKDPGTGQEVELGETPYMRGIPLSKLAYEKGATNFKAPHATATDDKYFPVDDFISNEMNSRRKYLIQTVVLEITNDPLLYSVDPYFGYNGTEEDIEYCSALDCLTRFRSEKIPNSPFQYRLGVNTTSTGRNFVDYVPTRPSQEEKIQIDRGTVERRYFKMLKEIELFRYPRLAQTAQQLCGRTQDNLNHYDACKTLEQHFLEPGNYNYTLDLGSFERDPKIDPVEDFVANHRSGHCEFFASALTLMLRSQGIPSRVVVGYRGGDYNSFGNYYQVQKKHAHAWVEAFIRGKDVPDHIRARHRAARQYGIWLRLDPTPPSDLDSNDFLGNDAFGFARSLWHDYILGITGEGEAGLNKEGWQNSALGVVTQIFDLNWWSARFREFQKSFQDSQSPVYYLRFIIPLLLVAYCFNEWRKRRGLSADEKRELAQKSSIRKFLGQTLSLVSPRLAQWVTGEEPTEHIVVSFYERFSKLLGTFDQRRNQTQTQLEFAAQVSAKFPNSSEHSQIEKLVHLITDKFYLVRFGGRELKTAELEEVDAALTQLEFLLNSEARAANQGDT